MGFWAFVRDILGVWSPVFGSLEARSRVFGLIGIRYQGWAGGNARDSGQGAT